MPFYLLLPVVGTFSPAACGAAGFCHLAAAFVFRAVFSARIRHRWRARYRPFWLRPRCFGRQVGMTSGGKQGHLAGV